jgi:endo-1,4-beta-D-glucanase Y
VRIRSYTLPLTVLVSFPVAFVAGCAAQSGSGDFSESGSTQQSQSGNSSSSGSSQSTGSAHSSSASSGNTQGTSASSSSTGSAAAGAGWNQPTAANSTGQFPFPQNRTVSRCTYPTTSVSSLNSLVNSAYTKWKGDLVVTTGAPGGAARVQDPQTSNRTVSEGIGYGMLITVYMADKTTFDELWAYAQAHFNNGLMNWEIDSSGNTQGTGSATDADQDMGWALLMADKQWPGGSYGSAATTLIGHISGEMANGFPSVGNQDNANEYYDYFSPAYYPKFGGSFPGDVSTGYSKLNSVKSSINLIPDSTNSSQFGFDACRAPWRIGVDYCMNGTASAQTFLGPMATFFVGKGVSGLKLPMDLSGNPASGASSTGAIAGPAAVAAMSSSSDQAFVTSAVTTIYSLSTTADTTGKVNYFGSSLGVLSLLELSGNFFDYSNPPQ